LAEAAVVAVAAEELVAAPDAAELDDDDELVELDLEELEHAAPTMLSMSSGAARLRAFLDRIMDPNLLVVGADVTSPLLSTPIPGLRGT